MIILARWAESDFQSALAWAEQNPSGNEGLNLSLLYVVEAIATSQPALVAQLLETQPMIRERHVTLDRFIPKIMSIGVEEAKLWPSYFEDPSLRAAAEARIAGSLVMEDVEGTMEWIDGLDGPGRDSAYSKAVEALAIVDTETALDYAIEAPSNSVRKELFAGIVRSTARRDPKQAASLIDAHPEVVTDEGIQGLIWYSVQRDPAVGAEYLNRIEGEQALEISLRTLKANWRGRDPAALESWLAENPQYNRP